MDVTAFVGKLLEEDDVDLLRDGVRVLAQALMETEVSSQIGAAPYERTGTRTAYRNGYRTRTWDTRVGTIELKIPKLTAGTYFPSLLEPRRRAEKALHAVICEAYVKGVSTRKVDDLVRALGIERVRKRQWLGVATALIGTVLFFLPDRGAEAVATFGFGDLINLTSAASFAIYGLVSAPLFARYPGRTAMAHTMGLGTLPLLAYGLPTLRGADWAAIPAGSWAVAVLSGTFAVYIGYWIWNWAIGAKGLAHTSLYLYLDIVLSGAFAYLFLDESFGPTRMLGAAVILLGVHLAAQRLPPEPAG